MPQYLKCLATVPGDLLFIRIYVSNCCLFSDINISQSSLVTRLKYGEILSYIFTANLLLTLKWKNWKSAKIWQSYRHYFGDLLLLEHGVYM